MILDATAFCREMWYDKKYSDCIYMDKRKGKFRADSYKDNPKFEKLEWDIRPTVQAVWEKLPFRDEVFDQVLFDPPHKIGNSYSVFSDKYGQLELWGWQKQLYNASKEFLRVLKPKGLLFFKWAETCKASDRAIKVIEAGGFKPLFGSNTTSGKTSAVWVTYCKNLTVPAKDSSGSEQK